MIDPKVIESHLIFRMGGVMKALHKRANQLLIEKGQDIQLEQIPPLMVAHIKGGQSQQEIADELGRDKSSINRTITWLVKHGYVSVSSDPDDKRRNIIKTTKKGESLAMVIYEDMVVFNKMVTDNISKTDIDHLNATMDKVLKLLE